MTGRKIVSQAWDATEKFGKCGKFGGAVTVEIVRNGLREEGIRTSARDVFVKGVPVEIDLIIPHHDAKPTLGDILYDPSEVAVALEIKKSGSYGRKSLTSIRRNFKQLAANGVRCAYLTLQERKSYCHKATPANVGARCFTLHWSQPASAPFKATDHWDRLVRFLQSATRS
jgi:hypothetical protein